MEKNPYEIDFEEYIRHTDASKKDKTFAWSTAIGLQQVDGLKPSSYLYETAKKNIEGELSFDEAKNLIDSYYESRTARSQDDERTEEADKVSSRIAQILSEPSFNFSPSHLIAIHKRLFEGIFKFAGKIRDYDITKKEWVLNGDTVTYASFQSIKETLEYYKKVLNRCSNRENAPQFYNKKPTVDEQYYSGRQEESNQDFLAIVKEYDEANNLAIVEERNFFKINSEVEIFGPNLEPITYKINKILNDKNELIDAARHPQEILKINVPCVVNKGDIIRVKIS